MTWIDVASDAVKIGLGAFIGAAAALISQFTQHSHKLSEEYSRRRKDTLEKIMADFDPACLEVMHRSANCIKFDGDQPDPDERQDEFRIALNAFNPLESKLRLLNFPKIAKDIDTFRAEACLLRSSSISSNPNRDIEFYGNLGTRLHALREKILDGLASAYKIA